LESYKSSVSNNLGGLIDFESIPFTAGTRLLSGHLPGIILSLGGSYTVNRRNDKRRFRSRKALILGSEAKQKYPFRRCKKSGINKAISTKAN